MTEDELKNFLFRLSVEAIYRLSDGSNDPITIQESLERNSDTNLILYCVEITDVFNHTNSEKDVKFNLSQNYKDENPHLTKVYGLDKLIWMFKLPQYDSGPIETLMESDEDKLEFSSEEGVVEWLTRSTVELINFDKKIFNLSLKDFHNSVVRAESD